MIVEHYWNDPDEGTPNYSKQNLFQWHFTINMHYT